MQRLEELKQLKEQIEIQKYNNPKVYEECEIYSMYTVFGELLENIIELQEGK